MGWGEPVTGNQPDDNQPSTEIGSNGGCQIWGILNVTPDSFSDGGCFLNKQSAINHARKMLQEGAHIIDVGGESSRPKGPDYGNGATVIPTEEEINRVIPVVQAITQDLGGTVSVDTTKAKVAADAIKAGASIINDISCGMNPDLLNVVAQTKVQLLLMHNRGQGEITKENVYYRDLVKEVIIELMDAVERAVEVGVNRMRIWIDPGIGFAKTAEQNIELLAHIHELSATGYPVLVGPSRKSFIAKIAPNFNNESPSPLEREGGTAAAVYASVAGGARAVRVHEVGLMRQVVRIAESINSLLPASMKQHTNENALKEMT